MLAFISRSRSKAITYSFEFSDKHVLSIKLGSVYINVTEYDNSNVIDHWFSLTNTTDAARAVIYQILNKDKVVETFF